MIIKIFIHFFKSAALALFVLFLWHSWQELLDFLDGRGDYAPPEIGARPPTKKKVEDKPIKKEKILKTVSTNIFPRDRQREPNSRRPWLAFPRLTPGESEGLHGN